MARSIWGLSFWARSFARVALELPGTQTSFTPYVFSKFGIRAFRMAASLDPHAATTSSFVWADARVAEASNTRTVINRVALVRFIAVSPGPGCQPGPLALSFPSFVSRPARLWGLSYASIGQIDVARSWSTAHSLRT